MMTMLLYPVIVILFSAQNGGYSPEKTYRELKLMNPAVDLMPEG